MCFCRDPIEIASMCARIAMSISAFYATIRSSINFQRITPLKTSTSLPQPTITVSSKTRSRQHLLITSANQPYIVEIKHSISKRTRTVSRQTLHHSLTIDNTPLMVAIKRVSSCDRTMADELLIGLSSTTTMAFRRILSPSDVISESCAS